MISLARASGRVRRELELGARLERSAKSSLRLLRVEPSEATSAARRSSSSGSSSPSAANTARSSRGPRDAPTVRTRSISLLARLRGEERAHAARSSLDGEAAATDELRHRHPRGGHTGAIAAQSSPTQARNVVIGTAAAPCDAASYTLARRLPEPAQHIFVVSARRRHREQRVFGHRLEPMHRLACWETMADMGFR